MKVKIDWLDAIVILLVFNIQVFITKYFITNIKFLIIVSILYLIVDFIPFIQRG